MKLDRPQREPPRPGSQILEWVLATAILTLAIYVILQVLGGSVDPIVQQALELWRRLIGNG